MCWVVQHSDVAICLPGAASPQAVRKMLALSEPNKTRPHQPRHPPQPPLPIPGLAHLPHHHSSLSPSPSPSSHRRVCSSAVIAGVTTRDHPGAGGRALHERSHSDTPTLPLPSVDLSAESSSVTSLSNLPLRKTLTSGMSSILLLLPLISYTLLTMLVLTRRGTCITPCGVQE